MLDIKCLTDLKSITKGTMPLRNYYIPYESEEACLRKDERYNKRFLSLNGIWDFNYYENIEDADINNITYNNKIEVPSCTQLQGFDSPHYTNVPYPFPYDPPNILKSNPCFAYHRKFEITNCKSKTYINFLGVDSFFYLYINDHFVGYSQVSHACSEFDITPYINTGTNTVKVFVAKYCAGSYLEGQDKWRLSGIFRDVFLLFRPEQHIENYTIKTDISGSVNISTTKPVQFAAKLLETGQIAEGTGSVTLNVNNPKLWNAENPNLYNLIIICNGEYILEEIGFREIKAVNGVIKVNGKEIKFRGVNRHEFDPIRGSAITRESIINDLKIIKQHNINAIRTSHYPNHPEFYKLCNRYGFYVIDEADIECHGVLTQNGDWNESLFHDLAENPEYAEMFLHRIRCLYERDKNFSCILFWSLGNESGMGPNLEAGAKYLKEQDQSRLIHYEGIWYRRDKSNHYDDIIDVASCMYPDYEWLKSFPDDAMEKRPLIVVEYAHSMGNSPGDLKDYWDIIKDNSRIAGAFVWEFCDHAIFMNGRFNYGGDFGEDYHDKNFCIDGLVTADRKIKPGIKELKQVLAQVRISAVNIDNGHYRFENFYDFTNFDKLKICYTIRLNSKEIKKGEIIPNENNFDFTIQYPHMEKGFCNILFRVVLNQENDLYEKDYEIYYTSFVLQEPEIVQNQKTCDISVTEKRNLLNVSAGDYTYIFEKNSGILKQITYHDNNLLTSGIKLQCMRASTDNDVYLIHIFEQYRLLKLRQYATQYSLINNSLEFKGKLVYDIIHPPVSFNIRYTFLNNGVDIHIDAEVAEYVKLLPRFGVTFALDKSFRKAEYLGYGPYESYIDKRNASYKDIFRFDVLNDYQSYLKPQESSSHFGCNYLKISDNDKTICINSNTSFSCSAVPYDVKTLMETKNSSNLPEIQNTYVNIDYKMMGIGSASCGKPLMEKYLLKEKKISFGFTLSLIQD
jgi:beta-galactosidase